MTEAQKKAKAEYRKKVRTIHIEIYPTEQDILEKLDSVERYGTYIKRLIREDIAKAGE